MKNDEWYIRSTFQPPPSSLQYPQRYYNQNIARNWVISINLGEKSQNCLFWQTWYLKDVVSSFEISFLNFQPFLGKFRTKKSKLSVLPKNWNIWYLGGPYSKPGSRFSNFRPLNSFLAKFGPKKSILSVLPENWHTWYLGRADSKSWVRFTKLQPQNPPLGKFGSKNHSSFVLI